MFPDHLPDLDPKERLDKIHADAKTWSDTGL